MFRLDRSSTSRSQRFLYRPLGLDSVIPFPMTQVFFLAPTFDESSVVSVLRSLHRSPMSWSSTLHCVRSTLGHIHPLLSLEEIGSWGRITTSQHTSQLRSGSSCDSPNVTLEQSGRVVQTFHSFSKGVKKSPL